MNLIIEILIYAIIIFALVILPFIPNIFPNLKLEHILVALTTLVAGSYLNLNQKFEKITKKLSFLGLERIFHYDSFGKAFSFVEGQIQTVSDLRIYDISTRTIFPAISSGAIHIKKCTLILRGFYPNDPSRDDSLATEVNLFIAKWHTLVDEKKIEELNIYSFFDNPTDYMCLFDNKYAISGQYVFDSTIVDGDQNFDIKSLTPMLVTNETKQGSDMITQFCERFERLVEVSKFHSAKSPFFGNVLAFARRTIPQKEKIFTEEIKNADCISAIGIANNELTSDLSAKFYQDFFLERNGKIRIMFSKPESESLILREQHENRAKGSLSFFVLHNIEDLNRYIDECGRSSCDCQIKVYDFYPQINCIITNNYVFLHYYGQAARGLDVPTFIISKRENPDIYDYYLSEFNMLWERGSDYYSD